MASSEPRRLSLEIARFPLKTPFVIARGAKTEAVTLVATITQGEATGRGECTPYARYGESVDSVVAAIESIRGAVEAGADRAALQRLLPAGAARNALDCALWDLDAKISGVPAFQLAGLHAIAPCVTAFTLSVGTPDEMAQAAKAAAGRPVLKVKLAGAGDAERLAAVRAAAPDSELIVDANEAWRPENLDQNFAACAAAGVVLVEQPLPADQDSALALKKWPVAVCADESVHDRKGLAALRDRYDLVNIKLDKTGGLTEALALAAEAEKLGFGLFVGCMVASSLAMSPALLLAARARFVDLDGPLLLARDRPHGLRYDGSILFPPEPALWG
ncbi:N-acetyl-D-Glu racemase DgcA [Rhodoblastus sp.]|uniref:N-acetyl-D-Glu racemase DgcA n=1 Tax=Rhodoblastus sp. TaxID=1962975 RepID=UPI003F967E52